MIIGQEKPSLEELTLEHFGTKGMHWGVRNQKSNAKSSASPKKSTATSVSSYDAAQRKRAIAIGALRVAVILGVVGTRIVLGRSIVQARDAALLANPPGLIGGV